MEAWVRVAIFQQKVEAHMARDFLRASGIQAQLRADTGQSIRWNMELLVLEGDEAEAKRLLSDK